MTNKFKVSVVAGVVIGLALLFFGSLQARADQLNFQGSDTGGFSAAGGSNVYQSLTYNATVFGPSTTSGGLASLNLGYFTLQNVTASYGGNFAVNVTFTIPAGGSGNTFTSTVMGSVSNGSGSALILNFGPAQFVSFSNGVDYGSFDLGVNGLSVNADGSKYELTGYITNAQQFAVPELPTILLSAVGIAGLLLLKRRPLISA